MLSPSYPFFKADQSGTAVLVHTGSTNITTLEAQNINTVDLFIQLFDAASASSVTVGTTTPNQSFVIPASDGTNRAATSKDWADRGLMFRNGLVIAITTTATGSTSPGTACVVNISYS